MQPAWLAHRQRLRISTFDRTYGDVHVGDDFAMRVRAAQLAVSRMYCAAVCCWASGSVMPFTSMANRPAGATQ